MDENEKLDDIEKNENTEDAIETEEDKRNDYAHDDIIEMLRSIEEELNSYDGAFKEIKDMVSMFVQNGAIIRENDDENTVVDDVMNQLSLDNLDLVL